MARVPLDLQQYPEEQLQLGSEVQFDATDVKPVKDVVSDDIATSAEALSKTGEIIQKLDDELNDAESKQLYNNFFEELSDISSEYLTTEGAAAVQTINQKDGSTTNPFEVTNKKIEELYEKHRNNATNGVVQFMFDNMAEVSVRDVQRKHTQHSIKQKNWFLNKEHEIQISNHAKTATLNYESWKDPNGGFFKSYKQGLDLIDEWATRNGLRITEGPNGEPVNQLYLDKKYQYQLQIYKGVVANFEANEDSASATEFMLSIAPEDIKEEDRLDITQSIAEKHDDYNAGKIVDGILNINNPTTSTEGNIEIMMGLCANNTRDNNNGGAVVDCFNTDEINVSGYSKADIKKTLVAIRDTSKFYNVKSGATLPEGHKITHFFALTKIGVEKADSFYTTAKNTIYEELKVDKEKYQVDLEYQKEIDGKVLDKYNELIINEVKVRYSSKTEALKKDLENKITNLELSAGESGLVPNTPKYIEHQRLKEELKKVDSKFTDQVTNDLGVIKNGFKYETVNEITGLMPLEVYKQNIKATIKDEKQLKLALQDVENKYEAIAKAKTEEYNNNLNLAKDIAFARDGGWHDLAASGIDIKTFTKEDQEILKNGHPKESDSSVVVDLKVNPSDLEVNLDKNRHKLNRLTYQDLVDYRDKLNETKVIEATINADMLDLTLKEHNLDHLRPEHHGNNKKLAKKRADDYLQISQRWEFLIDEEQTNTNKKLTRKRKKEILEGILKNRVMLDPKGWTWFGKPGGDDFSIPAAAAKDETHTYVSVGTETVWLYEINDFQRKVMIAEILARGKVPTEKLIAEMWVFGGKSKIDNKDDWDRYNEEKEISFTSSMQ